MKNGQGQAPAEDHFRKLAEIIYNYTMECMDDVVPYHDRPEEQKLEIEEIATFSIQTALAILEKFSLGASMDMARLDRAYRLIKEEKFEEADDFLFGEGEDSP